ncbi:MAG: hypothetical protein AAGC60_27745 [Acidobacteriota bacterium]
MDPAQRSLVFFKIFDLAFFAPGSVVGVTAAVIWWPELNSFLADDNLGVAGGILLSLAVLVVVYVAGLVIFSLAWWLFRRHRQSKSLCQKPHEVSPYGDRDWLATPLLFDREVRTELILYFWYLRATCLSVSVALALAGIGLVFADCALSCSDLWFVGGVALLAPLLWWKGISYHKTFERSLAPHARQLQAIVDDQTFTWS